MAKKEMKALGGAASGAATGTAIMPGWGTAIGALAGGAMGLLGGDDNDGSEQMAANKALWNSLVAPNGQDLSVNLDNYKYAGDISNKMNSAEQLGQRDALQNVNLDPRLKQAQMNSLDTLSKIAGSGFTPDEKASMDASRQQRDADLTSKLKSLQQSQDSRGVGNSDMALAQRMMGAQSSANSGAADARNEQAQAYKRSLDAIMARGNMASSMDNTDYNRQANLANNLNSRELTNMNNRTAVNRSNVDSFNDALKYNNTNQQNLLNNNTNSQHKQVMFNSDAKNQGFNNQIKKVQGQTGANISELNNNSNNQTRNDNQLSGAFDGIAKAGGAYLADQKMQAQKAPAEVEHTDQNDALMAFKKKFGQP